MRVLVVGEAAVVVSVGIIVVSIIVVIVVEHIPITVFECKVLRIISTTRAV